MAATRSNWRIATALLLFLALSCGCGSRKPAPAPQDQTASSDNNAAQTPAPEAKIHISYTHPGDYLRTLTVTKYEGAQMLRSGGGANPNASSTVRFQAGIVVWQFNVEKGFLGGIPGLNERKEYAPAQVKYGALPAHFVKSLPDGGPPEPLEPDHFYVFEVVRASGSTSYEAVKVNYDGSLEAYAAEPRAGDSYELCCGIAQDFVFSPPAEAAAPPPDSP